MNERIKELREQALTMVSDEQQDHGESYEIRELWDRHDQKFAELIVRECAKVADRADENGCECIGGNILIHFGVKE